MTPAEELERLLFGGLRPAEPELDELTASVPGGAAAALARMREVLEPVLRHSSGVWPALSEWPAELPQWFLGHCVDDALLRDCVLDRWSLRGWLYWLEPERRKWRWAGAGAGTDELRIQLQVLERPYLRGALEWLLRVASA